MSSRNPAGAGDGPEEGDDDDCDDRDKDFGCDQCGGGLTRRTCTPWPWRRRQALPRQQGRRSQRPESQIRSQPSSRFSCVFTPQELGIEWDLLEFFRTDLFLKVDKDLSKTIWIFALKYVADTRLRHWFWCVSDWWKRKYRRMILQLKMKNVSWIWYQL